MRLEKIAGYCWFQIKLSCFFHSLTGREKLPAVTEFFVLKCCLQITYAPSNESSMYCVVEHANTYTNVTMARKHVFTKKVCSIK